MATKHISYFKNSAFPCYSWKSAQNPMRPQEAGSVRPAGPKVRSPTNAPGHCPATPGRPQHLAAIPSEPTLLPLINSARQGLLYRGRASSTSLES